MSDSGPLPPDGEDWVKLQRDLNELEATDPAVREAARRYDAMTEHLTGRAIRMRSAGD